ncbi:hypothetical protein [Brevundimonas sp. R86498]|uniref:hypothetical protein n=1 Tax=Brevundimonas sp. R86498 TaxID=3093845 RepID=UPI0037C6582D
MKVLCFSSFTFSYLNRARVLYRSLRQHHPDWHLVALVVDRPPDGIVLDPENEDFDRVVYADQLDIPDVRAWLFRHNIVEACTAVKGPFLRLACDMGADAVVYLDPDTALLNPLDTVTDALRDHDGVLTPHMLEPEETLQAILDNEQATLRTGIFNLGFLAIRTTAEGRRFAAWWSDRLLRFCYDDIPSGLFVDQRWCDHIPAFFPTFTVLRDPGCNVASWNLSRRTVRIDWEGRITVNGSPLRFWHFTKLGPIGDIMTRRYAGANFEVHEIWNWYKREIDAATDPRIPTGYWHYGQYGDGVPIPAADRGLYRTRQDLQAAFPDPFASGPGSYQAWLAESTE